MTLNIHERIYIVASHDVDIPREYPLVVPWTENIWYQKCVFWAVRDDYYIIMEI
jgi:hypothetical protein